MSSQNPNQPKQTIPQTEFELIQSAVEARAELPDIGRDPSGENRHYHPGSVLKRWLIRKNSLLGAVTGDESLYDSGHQHHKDIVEKEGGEFDPLDIYGKQFKVADIDANNAILAARSDYASRLKAYNEAHPNSPIDSLDGLRPYPSPEVLAERRAQAIEDQERERIYEQAEDDYNDYPPEWWATIEKYRDSSREAYRELEQAKCDVRELESRIEELETRLHRLRTDEVDLHRLDKKQRVRTIKQADRSDIARDRKAEQDRSERGRRVNYTLGELKEAKSAYPDHKRRAEQAEASYTAIATAEEAEKAEALKTPLVIDSKIFTPPPEQPKQPEDPTPPTPPETTTES